MKILLVHNRYRSNAPSGENSVVDDEVRLLEASGAFVERLELQSDEIGDWPAARRMRLPLRVIWSPKGGQLVSEAAAAFGPDVIHVHNTFPLFSPRALVAAHRSGAAVVQTLHNFRSLCPEGSFFRDGSPCTQCLGRRVQAPALRYRCYRSSVAATLPLVAMNAVHRSLGTWARNVSAFVIPSRFGRDRYGEAGWPTERIFVNYNTASPLATLGERHPDGETFLYVGRLTHEKGVSTLLRAWLHAFPVSGPQLVVIGGGDAEEEIRALAGGSPRVSFLGQQPPEVVTAHLLRASALVVPSQCFEMCPRVIPEAYALGVPVIASRLGSLAELVIDGETGLLAEPANVDDFARVLGKAAASEAELAELGRRARQRYEQLFAPGACLTRLLAIYEAAATLQSGGRSELDPVPAG